MVKTLNTITALLLCTHGLSAKADTLVTEHYEVVITVNCDEHEISCADVTFDSKNFENGKSIQLKGKTLHSLCADDVTPCRFLGYLFKNGNIDYFVQQDGLLEVIQDKKILVSEWGEWVY